MKHSQLSYNLKEILDELNIKLQETDLHTASLIIDRDDHGSTKYIRSVDMKFGKKKKIVSLSIRGYLVGYYLAGCFTRGDKKIGASGMVHISPPVRDLGLGSLLFLIQYQYLMESEPDVLHCQIADKTGKIYHLVKELNFHNSGEVSEKGAQPIWVREFFSEEERNTFKKYLETCIHNRLTKLARNKRKIQTQAMLVDIDNPDLVDIEQTVTERLKTPDLSDPFKTVTFFGYRGSKVRLTWLPAKMSSDEVAGYRIVLEVKDIDLTRAQAFLQERRIQNLFGISIEYTLKEEPMGDITITLYPQWDIKFLKQTTQKFASVGKELFTFSHTK